MALFGALLVEFLLLFTTKYWNNLSLATGWMNPLNIIVPLGISFYTFQTVGYLFDVYRKQIEAEKNIINYAAFLSFFPHLLAGPIEPSQNFLPQIKKPVDFNYTQMAFGILLISVGLFKKLVIADTLAPIIDIVFQTPAEHKGAAIGLTAFLARYQIYCDFSGYTDIALGSAQILGFKLMQNFNRPFFSTSATQYWQRWHISLSVWIRNYVFYPLVSTPVARIGVHGLILLTFLILGLWHGGTYNFVLYGFWHGTFVVFDAFTRHRRHKIYSKIGINSEANWFKFFAILFTFFIIVVPPTLLFSSPNWSTSVVLFNNVWMPWSWQDLNYISKSLILTTKLKTALIAIFAMETIHYLQIKYVFTDRIWNKSSFAFWFLIITVLVVTGFLGSYNEEIRFIYMQF